MEEKLDAKIIAKLALFNIDKVDAFCVSDLALNLTFNKTYYLIANNNFYIFSSDFKLLKTILLTDIKEYKLEPLLNYGKLSFLVANNWEVIGYILKSEQMVFENFLKKIKEPFSKENKEFGYCKKCHKIIPNNLNYCPNCYGKFKVLFRLLSYGKKYIGSYIFIIILLIISGTIGVFIPILTNKFFYNKILSESSWYGKILEFSLIYLAILAISSLISIIYGRIISKNAAKLAYDLKNEVFLNMSQLSLDFYSNNKTGSLMNRISFDVEHIISFINEAIPNFIIDFLKATGMVTYLLILNPKLSLFSFIPLPFILLIFLKVFPKFKENWQQYMSKNHELVSLVNDSIDGYKVVKAFSNENKEKERFNKASDNSKKAIIFQRQYQNTFMTLIQVLVSSSLLIIWGVGGYYLINKQVMNYGDFMTFIAGIELLYNPLEAMSRIIFEELPHTLSCARRMFEIEDAPIDVKESINPISDFKIDGEIEFKDVSFAYVPFKDVLKNISFKIKPNTKVGIVGKTGAGKTTLAYLIARLYDVNKGEILLDNYNIKDLSLASLHQTIALISQDTYLFNASIYENVAFANKNASKEEVIEACKKAYAHEFIINTKDGYETKIGEGGINLSGGERQRIAIARAFLCKASIIIFDEATSSMDTISERKIEQAINNLKENKTLFIIAHRLSSLKNVDYILVLKDGEIIEKGNMQELLALNGEFATLYHIQEEALKYIRIGDEYDGLSRL